MELIDAAKAGDLERVKNLLSAGADLNFRDPKTGRTPLLAAIAEFSAPVANALIEAGADLRAKDKDGWTVPTLAMAKMPGWPKILVKALEKGAEPNAKAAGGMTALMFSAERDSVEAVKALLEHGADPNAKDEKGEHALMKNARRRTANCTEILLKSGSAVNARNNEGHTALYIAAESGSEYAADSLISLGADVNVRTNEGMTPLMAAASGGGWMMVGRLLMENVDLEAVDKEGRTALMYSAMSGTNKCMKGLFMKGASVHKRDNIGRTALIYAAQVKKLDMVEMLIDEGADVNAADASGITALHQAASVADAASVEKLIKHGANIEAENSEGKRPLEFALSDAEFNAVEPLIMHGADLIRTFHDGLTVLSRVIERRKVSEFLAVVRKKWGANYRKRVAVVLVGVSYFDPTFRLTIDAASAIADFLRDGLTLANMDFTATYLDRSSTRPKTSMSWHRAYLRCLIPSLPADDFRQEVVKLLQSSNDALPHAACFVSMGLVPFGWFQLHMAAALLEECTALSKGSPLHESLYQESFTTISDIMYEQLNQAQQHGANLDLIVDEGSRGPNEALGRPIVERLERAGAAKVLSHAVMAKVLDDVWAGRREMWTLESVARDFARQFFYAPPRYLTHPEWIKRKHPSDMWADSWAFLAVPCGMWALEALCRLCFIGLTFAYTCIVNNSREEALFSPVGVAFWLFVAGFFMEEVNEAARKGLSRYFSIVWNVVDSIMLSGFAITFIFLVVSPYLTDGSGVIWRTVLAVSSLFSWIRVLELFLINKEIGPLVIGMFNLVRDTFVFMTIFIVVLVGFGQAFTVLHASDLNPASVMWALLWSFLGRDSDSMSPDTLGEALPVLGPLLLLSFLIITTILVLNLLIAQFSYTFQRVSDTREQEYALQRTRIIVERLTWKKKGVPAPFNLLELAFFWLPSQYRADLVTLVVLLVLSPLYVLLVAYVSMVWLGARAGKGMDEVSIRLSSYWRRVASFFRALRRRNRWIRLPGKDNDSDEGKDRVGGAGKTKVGGEVEKDDEDFDEKRTEALCSGLGKFPRYVEPKPVSLEEVVAKLEVLMDTSRQSGSEILKQLSEHVSEREERKKLHERMESMRKTDKQILEQLSEQEREREERRKLQERMESMRKTDKQILEQLNQAIEGKQPPTEFSPSPRPEQADAGKAARTSSSKDAGVPVLGSRRPSASSPSSPAEQADVGKGGRTSLSKDAGTSVLGSRRHSGPSHDEHVSIGPAKIHPEPKETSLDGDVMPLLAEILKRIERRSEEPNSDVMPVLAEILKRIEKISEASELLATPSSPTSAVQKRKKLGRLFGSSKT